MGNEASTDDPDTAAPAGDPRTGPADAPTDTPADRRGNRRAKRRQRRQERLDRRHRNRWKRRARRALALVFLAGCLIYGALVFTALDVRAPVWVTDWLEERVNRDLAGARVSVGRIDLSVDRTLRPRVQMHDVGIFDARGLELARLNRVRARFDPAGLLQGRMTLKSLRLSGAQITVRRRADGTFDLSLGAGAGASGTLAGVLDALDGVFSRPPLTGLDQVLADQLTITLEDGRSGRIWQVTEGSIRLQQSKDALDVTVSADVFNGTEELANAVIGISTDKESSRATLTATFENAAAGDIAAQSPALAFLSVMDAQISGALRATIDAGGTVGGLVGTLEVGAGVVQPTPKATIAFEGGRAYVAYDAARRSLAFSQVSLQSDTARITAEGRAYLQDFANGWPASLVGQFSLSDVELEPENVFAEPMRFAAGAVDFRLRLDPFELDIGQVSLTNGDQRFLGRGHVSAGAGGWDMALDLGLNTIPLNRLLALWPVAFAPGTRAWLARNISTGDISDLTGAVRLAQGGQPQIALNYTFSDAEVKFIQTLPPVTGGSGYASLVNDSYTTVIETGLIAAPSGGMIDVEGTVFHIPDVTIPQGLAEVTLRTDSTITAALSLLDLKPFQLMTKAGLATDLAEGRAKVRSDIAFNLKRVIELPDVSYKVAGTLIDVTSEKLVPKRKISGTDLSLNASRDGISIGGRGKLGVLPVDAVWSQDFGPEARGSRVEGTAELSQKLLDEFGIGLPPGSVRGQGVANVELDLFADAAPKFRLRSDMNRVTLRLAALDWSKAANRTGRLEVSGRLGTQPSIDRLVFEAPGLSATGRVELKSNGALDVARFDRVELGGWLDGPVALRGRGPNAPVGVEMGGGRIDLRRATLGGSGGDASDGRGSSGPIDLRLDRLTVTEGIALTSFAGKFRNDRGLDGTFTARVNGGTPISGTLVPTRAGIAVRLRSNDAGGTIASADMLRNMRGGTLDLVLNPTGAEGTYNGRLTVRRTRVVEAPALTEMLSAISIVGLIDQMNSGGITLSEIEGEFRLTPTSVTLYRSSAVGPSIGVSLDGFIDLTRDRIDMQGVISPVYFLNGIGQLFSRRGEGLFGFNFRLRGETFSPDVTVNPLSILTPGMFREIFRRAPPTPSRGQ